MKAIAFLGGKWPKLCFPRKELSELDCVGDFVLFHFIPETERGEERGEGCSWMWGEGGGTAPFS